MADHYLRNGKALWPGAWGMIYIGLDDHNKIPIIERYKNDNSIKKIVVISADAFPISVLGADHIKFSDVIMYVTFYRLIQEIDQWTLVVVNECLRTQNRYDLAYNCIRNFLNQTNHQLIFQQFPQIDTVEDFMILFDFDTKSRWKREKFNQSLVLDNANICITPHLLSFNRVDIPTSPSTKAKYQKDRDFLFANLGAKDPHTLPRTLYLIGGKDKLTWIDNQSLPLFFSQASYVARNKRLNRDNISPYSDVTAGAYTIVEFPHRFIDFSDFIKTTGQHGCDVLVADLKVDHWYFQRYMDWRNRIYETYSSLQQ